jgi:hypothetical protein
LSVRANQKVRDQSRSLTTTLSIIPPQGSRNVGAFLIERIEPEVGLAECGRHHSRILEEGANL